MPGYYPEHQADMKVLVSPQLFHFETDLSIYICRYLKMSQLSEANSKRWLVLLFGSNIISFRPMMPS
jgi:hypothetical protein